MGEFFYFLDVYLLSRFFMLNHDQPQPPMNFAIITLIQVIAMLVFQLSSSIIALSVFVMALNAFHCLFEHRYPHKVNETRLASLLLAILFFAAMFSEALNPGFHPELQKTLRFHIASWTLFSDFIYPGLPYQAAVVIAGLLIATTEINYLIRVIFTHFSLLPFKPSDSDFDRRAYNAGRIIGILERTLIFLFVLSNLFSGIAFILAAKGFTRFKELDNRDFAEYVLIGTLLSTLFAICIGMATARLL